MAKLPGVTHLTAVRALERAGFRIIRQAKHIVMSDGVYVNEPGEAVACDGSR